ncbi:MAG: NAD-dependent epimerase/dehydratase family protein [Lachnospiraceae bacterium]|nr:NAD-dependent epimerase/dehydratase family protein [Lachnospiraceae bacterium]
MKKAIVTGANGFVGSALVKELVKNKIEVIALVHQGHADNIPKNDLIQIKNLELDKVAELYDDLKKEGADIFYHFAWKGSAGAERANTELQLANAQWTIDCIRLAKSIGCTRFVEAGSVMEIETYKATFNPGNKPGLGYVYGSGKLVAHTMAKSIAADLDIDLIWGMITNAYGVGEVSPRMVNTTIRKCIKGENPQFTAGTQNYDFVYIEDVARAFYLIGEKGKPFNEYMIGSSCAKPLKEFLLEMKEAIAPELEFIFGDIPFTGVNMPLSEFDCTKTFEDTGFKAKITFAEGCKKTRDWLITIEGDK